MKKPRVLVAASGSGGHLMPARLIAAQLLKLGADIAFVGSGRTLEKEIFGSLKVSCFVVPIEGVNNRGFVGILRFLLLLPRAIWVTCQIFKEFRPDVVLGVGGYASVLPIVLGATFGKKTWIHEAELHPGNANQFLSRFADVVSVAFKEVDGFSRAKTRFTGHPIREDVGKVEPLSESSSLRIKNLLVLGGSQGARSIDSALKELGTFIKSRGLSLYHQCRPESEEELRSYYNSIGIEEVRVAPFIHELGQAYEWSDLIICRAGAGTVMEIGVVNRPTIFVPFPHAQGNHQRKNADTVVSQGKALLIEEGEGFVDRLREAVTELLQLERYKEIVHRPVIDRPKDADFQIAKGVFELVTEK